MFKLLLVLIVSSSIALANDCEEKYDRRGESLNTTVEAYNCFNSLLGGSTKYEKSVFLNKMAYLKFFEGSFYENDSLNSLVSSFELAKDAIKLYGPLFNSSEVSNLPKAEVEQIALGYYLYGTSVSKYVDLKGKWEAIRRMSEIKNTMKMILSLKQPQTFHYGAYRTLAIFNLKVPRIAGGKLSLSKMFFEKLIKESMTAINVVSYPVGHIFYAEYLNRVGNKTQACKELDLVKSLTDEDINSYFKELKFETIKDRDLAKERFEQYSC